jgi:hypothetical protein
MGMVRDKEIVRAHECVQKLLNIEVCEILFFDTPISGEVVDYIGIILSNWAGPERKFVFKQLKRTGLFGSQVTVHGMFMGAARIY